MNMNFDRPHGTEVNFWADLGASIGPSQTFEISRPKRLATYLAGSLIIIGAVYGIAHASPSVLVGLGIAVISLLAIATAVCVYAQNNTLV